VLNEDAAATAAAAAAADDDDDNDDVGWPESPYRTRQMRAVLAKLPVDNLFVIEWLVTRRLISRVRSRHFCLTTASAKEVTGLSPSVCLTLSVITSCGYTKEGYT